MASKTYWIATIIVVYIYIWNIVNLLLLLPGLFTAITILLYGY